MTITFADLKAKVIRALGDIVVPGGSGGEPLAGTTYDKDLLKDSVHAALDAITVRRFKASVAQVAGDYGQMDVPDDLIEVEAILDITNNVFLEQVPMAVGKGMSPGGRLGWYIYPTGTIVFTDDLGDDGAELYYSAYWAKPEDDEEDLETPDICTTALVMYAASYCLLNSASQASSIRQFNMKVDSGKPTDNPLEQSSTYFMKRFEIELQRIPPSPKGVPV